MKMAVVRDLAPQRNLSLYLDQEEAIKNLMKEGYSRPQIVRAGVDLVLKTLKKGNSK